MSNALTTSPKVFSSASSTHSRLQSSSGADRDGILMQPRPNGLRSGSFNGSGVTGTSAASFDTRDPEKQLEELTQQLHREIKFKEGAENMLQALDSKKPKEVKVARNKAEMELSAVNIKIAQIKNQMEAIKNPPKDSIAARRAGSKFAGKPIQPPSNGTNFAELLNHPEIEAESPTFTLSDILQSLEEKGRRPEFYVENANKLVLLFKRHPMLKYDLVWSEFGKRVQSMLLHENREVIAAGYRITRYAITDIESLRTIRKLQTDYLTICSLAKDPKNTVEREQALKFIRAFIEVKGGVSEISRGVVRAIVSCAEQENDRLRGICLETLAELLILDASLVVGAGGIRILSQVLYEGPYELSDTLCLAFLYLLDMPATRKYIRAGHDMEVVFSAFTDSYQKPNVEEKLRSSAKVISSMLKSWPGLICLSMFEMRALRSLVDSLRIPSSGVRDIILELLFDIFRIKSPSWSSTFLAGRRLTTYGRVANLKSESKDPSPGKHDDENQSNLVEHFIALLLEVFVEAGLLKSLMTLVEDNSDPAIVRKTTLLLGEVLKLASRLLPTTYNLKIQLLPELFKSASRFGLDRFSASSAVYQIDSINRTLARSLSSTSTPQRLSLDDDRRGQRQAEQVKAKLTMQIDEAHFRSLLMECGVLGSSNYSKWNWELISEIIQGPLINWKRLEEAKSTKFLKRLLSFYRPFKHKFSDILNTKPNQRYVRVGCALFNTLLSSAEGVKYLSGNKLLFQIAECLAQLDPMSGISSPEPILSRARLADTLSSGYFTLLGTLSSDPKGLQMMQSHRMFNMFYHLSDLQDRDDLIIGFLSPMDYTLEGHPRVIFSKALTTGIRTVRLWATNHLRSLILAANAPLSPLNTKHHETAQWAIRLLVTQLYDTDVEVCETAVKILEEACNVTHNLEYVVKCRPALDHLGEIGAPLLLRFLSTSVGYHYLNELDYIEKEMDDWFHGRNDSYVLTVEASLARAFADDEPTRKKDIDREAMSFVPPHFYRELARTEEGCHLLREKGHFEEFTWFIKEHGLESEDIEVVTKVKGCLWAIGNIGSMPLGAPFLDEADIVESVINIAEHSQVLTLKGTAFFVLGLISKTMPGLEILLEHGWDGTTTTMGESLGFCVPLKLGQLLSIQPWEHMADDSNEKGRPALLSSDPDGDLMTTKILTSIVNLSNHILEISATKELTKLKTTHAAYFQSPDLYRCVMKLLESYRFRLHVRKQIMDLFPKHVLEEIVRGGMRDLEIKEISAQTQSTSVSPDEEKENVVHAS
ncbi:Rapamycin-insensitive companion of mTOR, N-term-domain-containing protein [Kalaharituber pfeilii]|nr:Rapamycin-insensitive companion of mTOR, N-term-domain-containing protein [Kalaharituber pfeilii]